MWSWFICAGHLVFQNGYKYFLGKLNIANMVFHKLDKIGNDANIGIRIFTWENKKKSSVTLSEYWTQASDELLIPNWTLSFLS